MTTNRYGVDVDYFNKELRSLSRSLPNRSPDELCRYLIRLADVAGSSCIGCRYNKDDGGCWRSEVLARPDEGLCRRETPDHYTPRTA